MDDFNCCIVSLIYEDRNVGRIPKRIGAEVPLVFIFRISLFESVLLFYFVTPVDICCSSQCSFFTQSYRIIV
jgi:hypothetical protein